MHFLYASKPGVTRKLVATFDTLPQLQAYVNWATLGHHENGTYKFEQGSALASYQSWEQSTTSEAGDDVESVVWSAPQNLNQVV